ncbi:MAG TPA: hypothetical protein VIJ25_01840, partial [Methylococcales bacterium]
MDFFNEYNLLYKSLKKRAENADGVISKTIENYRKKSEWIGRPLSDCDLLEIGVGQTRLGLAFFSSEARSAVGIDLDVIATRYNLIEFIKMARYNGITRTTRTFGRHILGLNDDLYREFCRQMGLGVFPKLTVFQGDICAGVKFKDAS